MRVQFKMLAESEDEMEMGYCYLLESFYMTVLRPFISQYGLAVSEHSKHSDFVCRYGSC